MWALISYLNIKFIVDVFKLIYICSVQIMELLSNNLPNDKKIRSYVIALDSLIIKYIDET